MHCHSTCIVQEEEEERKGQESGEAERKMSGTDKDRGRLEEPRGCHWAPCAAACSSLVLPGALGCVQGTGSEGGPDAHESE